MNVCQELKGEQRQDRVRKHCSFKAVARSRFANLSVKLGEGAATQFDVEPDNEKANSAQNPFRNPPKHYFPFGKGP